jgi:hypothetical protein
MGWGLRRRLPEVVTHLLGENAGKYKPEGSRKLLVPLPYLRPFFRHIVPHSLFLHPDPPPPCSHSRPLIAQFAVDFVLHSHHHLDPTNLLKALKQARVTSITSVPYHHPPPLSVHFIANVPLLAQSSLPSILGPILTQRSNLSPCQDLADWLPRPCAWPTRQVGSVGWVGRLGR